MFFFQIPIRFWFRRQNIHLKRFVIHPSSISSRFFTRPFKRRIRGNALQQQQQQQQQQQLLLFFVLFVIKLKRQSSTKCCFATTTATTATTVRKNSLILLLPFCSNWKKNLFDLNLTCAVKVWCSNYRKLVETFHNVSECKTVVYFGWWLTLQFLQPGDLDR